MPIGKVAIQGPQHIEELCLIQGGRWRNKRHIISDGVGYRYHIVCSQAFDIAMQNLRKIEHEWLPRRKVVQEVSLQ